MPWDADIDVQVSAPSLARLAAAYNNTVFPFHAASWLGDASLPTSLPPPSPSTSPSPSSPSSPQPSHSYLLDINPHFTHPSPSDTYNVIDARWIDLSSGLYIDITALRPNLSASAPPGQLFAKDRHTYAAAHIFPLRATVFEGVPAKVPYAFQEVLEEEYGAEALVERVFEREGYVFDEGVGEWRVEGWAERKERLGREREAVMRGERGRVGEAVGRDRVGRLMGGRGVVDGNEGEEGWWARARGLFV